MEWLAGVIGYVVTILAILLSVFALRYWRMFKAKLKPMAELFIELDRAFADDVVTKEECQRIWERVKRVWEDP